MIILNLISPEQKKLLKIKLLYQLLENFLGVLVIYSIILAIILIPINQSIDNINLEITQKKQEVKLKNQAITEKVQDLNKQIEILSIINNEFFNWSNYLINLSNLVPADISLNEISNTLENREIIIRGYSKNRDSLINFKDNLQNSLLFKEVQIPLSNFLTAEEITFEIKAKIN